MTSSAFPLPPFVLLGVALGAAGLVVGLVARRIAPARTLRIAGSLACGAALLLLALGSTPTGPVPAVIAGWLVWPVPSLLAAGATMLLPSVRGRAKAAQA